MALQKEIKLDNGIVLNYHRIASLNKLTNISNTIEVSSYINKDEREKEKQYQNLQLKSLEPETITNEEKAQLQNGINVLVETDYIQMEYNDGQTIEEAYNYLKTLDKYKDSIDV